jgi:hypothetical protein
MSPVVRYIDTGQEVSQFEPPLDVSVQFTEADAKATTLDSNGVPKLSLGVAYPADGGWKWEKLKTHVTKEGSGGTLHAKLHTLHSKEALFISKP